MPQSETRPETQPEMSPVTGLVGIDECEVGLCVDVLDSVNTWSEAKVFFAFLLTDRFICSFMQPYTHSFSALKGS